MPGSICCSEWDSAQSAEAGQPAHERTQRHASKSGRCDLFRKFLKVLMGKQKSLKSIRHVVHNLDGMASMHRSKIIRHGLANSKAMPANDKHILQSSSTISDDQRLVLFSFANPPGEGIS